MPEILKVNERGRLEIPATLLGNPKPGTRFNVIRSGSVLIIHPEILSLTWDLRTPNQRAAAFLEWANDFSCTFPPLPDSALSREGMYD
jgi:hypothetical protein